MKLHEPDFVSSDFVDQQRLLVGREVRAIVDAGANVGNTVALYMGLFPEAEMYAFRDQATQSLRGGISSGERFNESCDNN
jgi:hypothetical protein